MRHKFLWATSSLLASLLLGGCKQYSVSLNDNVVYTPPSIFKDYQLGDAQLFACVQQTIYDRHITRAEELEILNCSNAGIKSLAGLDKFFALKELNLAENNLTDISAVGNLGRLETLKLNDNQISSGAPLLYLLHLKSLDIKNNPQLDCKDLTQLIANLHHKKAEIILPAQCNKG